MQGYKARRASAHLIASAVVAVSFAAICQQASGAALFWDPISPEATPAIGGSGTWTTGDTNWRTALSEGSQGTWANGDTAYFGDVSGTALRLVTLGSSINANSLTFTSDRYTIEGNGFGITLGQDHLILTATDTTISAPIASSSGLIKRGLSALTLSGANTYTGQTYVVSGALRINTGNGGGNLGFTSDILLDPAAVLSVSNAGDTAINIPIAGTGRVIKSGAGVLSLSSSNTYSGGTTVSAGTLKITGNGALGDTAGTLILGDSLNKGTLSYEGATTSMTRALTINGGGGEIRTTLTASILTLTGAVGGTGRLTAGGAGKIAINSGMTQSGGLTKNDVGTLTLAGVNTFTGLTNINQGTVLLTGSLASGSAVTLASGATLGGTGTVAGSLNVHGILSPGIAAGLMATLATGATTWSTDGAYAADIASAGTADLLVMGNLVQQAGFTVSVKSADGLPNMVPGTYTWTLAKINNTATSFNLADITLVLSNNLQPYASDAQLIEEIDSGGAHTLALSMVVPEPATFLALALGLPVLLRRKRASR